MKRTNWLDRGQNKYYENMTRSEALDACEVAPWRMHHDLVPQSKWTREEAIFSAIALEVKQHPCQVCGTSVTCANQDAINAYCGCEG